MHIFDLTKNIKLEADSQKKYSIARVILHVVFSLTMIFIIYRILFPIIPLDFALDTPNSTKNTLVSVRIKQTGEFPPKKIIDANNTALFNANPIGIFSNANISMTMAKNSSNIENTTIKIRKSYQAFFYPTGEQSGFKDGTLVSTKDAAYYIVSNGLLRKFSNTDIILKLGYPKSAFIEISNDDLNLNKKGEDISDTENYPNDTLFAINDTYYQLRNQRLVPFISTRAFLSQYDALSAIAKNADFLSRYPVSQSYLGFADGTLASWTDSVFILSEGKSYPVENEVTFLAMGLNFDNVIPITSNELSAYKKQKQFTHDDPHPNGTIFVDQKTNAHFIVKDGKKIPMNRDVLIKTYSKQNPVIVDLAGSENETSCILKKNFFSSTSYSCDAPLDDLEALIGNDYQVSMTPNKSITLNNINTTFSTPMTFKTLMGSLSTIKTKLKNK
jgi:hypothetical protein